VMLEAFCAGLPVIATNVGGIRFHLPAQNGLLIASEDEAALLAAMHNMVMHYDQYNPTGIANRAAENYGYETIARIYAQTYRQYYPQLFH